MQTIKSFIASTGTDNNTIDGVIQNPAILESLLSKMRANKVDQMEVPLLESAYTNTGHFVVYHNFLGLIAQVPCTQQYACIYTAKLRKLNILAAQPQRG